MTHNRFATAQDGTRPTDAQLRGQRLIAAAIEDVADEVEYAAAPSRERSLALTKLEEALMWAGKAIFNPTPQGGAQ